MNTTTLQRVGYSLVVAVAALVAGCADEAPLGPDRGPALKVAHGTRTPDLGVCENLRVPADTKLALHVYAEGVQIYRWTGSAWNFEGPRADLFADAEGNGLIGIHYAGPKWESVSGSTVTGAIRERCTPDPNAIPWLLLDATPIGGAGIFHRVTFIQRLNTVGGNAPSAAGSFVGQVAEVPYTTEYFFYRPQ